MAWEAISKENVATLSGVKSTDLDDFMYDIAVDLIKKHTRLTNIGTTASVTESLDGNGISRIAVKQPPISAVSAVAIDGTTVPVADYTFDGYYIILKDNTSLINPYIRYQNFIKGYRNVTVSYTSGDTDNTVGGAIALIVKELSNLKTAEGAQARLMTYQPGQSRATEIPLMEWGIHGKIMGIIKTWIPKKFRFA